MKQSSTIKRSIFILCIVLAVGLLALLVLNGLQDRRKENQLARVKEKALPFEQELRQTQKELDELEEANYTHNDMSQVMVAYLIGVEDDFQLIEKQKKEYNNSPLVVLDVKQEKVDQLVKLAQMKKIPVVLTATPIDKDVLKFVSEAGKKYNISSFLLRNVDDNEENLETISVSGFKTCFRYLDVAGNQVLDNGLVCSNYSLIKSGSFSIGTRLKQLVTSKQSLMFVFDLSGGQLSEDAIVYDLTCISDWIDQGEMEYVSLDDAVTSIKNNQNQTAKNQNESSEYIAQLRTKIEELQNQIDEIYSHWNGD